MSRNQPSGTDLPHALNVRELIVYQRATDLARRVFAATKRFPPEEAYSLTDQVRRSSRSIGAQIAEAWAKRRYERHFISKLTDADAEQHETQHWIDVAHECGYLNGPQRRELLAGLREIGRMLGGMVRKAGSFCGTEDDRIAEEAPEYIADIPLSSEDTQP